MWDPLERQPFHIDDQGDVVVSGISLRNDVARLYWRDKRFLYEQRTGLSDSDQLAYWHDQWDAVYRYVDIAAPTDRQVDFRGYAMQANCRVQGRLAAKAVGFSVPDQILTNNIRKIGELANPIIYKRLSSILPSRTKMLYSSKIDKNFIYENADAFEFSPNLVQSYLNKVFELRVAVVEDEIYAVKIDSQASECTRTDWRVDQTRTEMFSDFKLSSDIKDRLMRFMYLTKINVGMFDFIVTPEGDFMFLECNPAGQWLFIPSFATIVTDAIGRLLKRR
ncbi:hypothetical protein ACWCOP_09885 [Maricaulaceae bacterium MS644]